MNDKGSIRPAWIMWGSFAAVVAGYELWATVTHHYTMSEAVWIAPWWAAAIVIGGLGYLIYHLWSGRKR